MVTDFVDSNVLIYCLKFGDPRRNRALDAVKRAPSTSVQALNELVSISRRKLRLSPEEANDAAATLQAILGIIHPLLLIDHQRAHEISKQYRLQWWDSLLLAVALRTGARRFLSEDLQQGQVIDGQLTITNPFS